MNLENTKERGKGGGGKTREIDSLSKKNRGVEDQLDQPVKSPIPINGRNHFLKTPQGRI